MHIKSLMSLLDLNEVKSILASFAAATGLVTSLNDHATGKPIASAGRRGLCELHWQQPGLKAQCRQNQYSLPEEPNLETEIYTRRCFCGLLDAYIPIKIQGEYFANLHAGQVFTTPPDIQELKAQARQYGFDETFYLQSAGRVPVVSEGRMRAALEHLVQMLSLLVKSELAQQDLKKHRTTLEESYVALKVLVNKNEREKKDFEERVATNILGMIEPCLKILHQSQLDAQQEKQLSIIEATLDNLTAPFVRTSTALNLKLTPSEIRTANLIKQNRSSKEIAQLMGISQRTVDKHRSNIRKKFGLNNEKINLKTFLSSQDGQL